MFFARNHLPNQRPVIEGIRAVVLEDDSEDLVKFPNNPGLLKGSSFSSISSAEFWVQSPEPPSDDSIHHSIRTTTTTTTEPELGKIINYTEEIEWQPDDSANCSIEDCDTLFSFFNRRHHCRHCGQLVCGKCSSKNFWLPISGKTVRTCLNCFTQQRWTASVDHDSRSLLDFEAIKIENVQDPQRKLDELHNENELAQHKINELLAKHALTRRNTEDLHAAKEAASIKVAELTAANQQGYKRIGQLIALKEEAKHNVAEISQENKKTQEKLRDISLDKQRLQDEYRKLQEQFKQMKMQSKQQEKYNKVLEQKVVEMTTANNGLSLQVNGLQATKEQIYKKYVDLFSEKEKTKQAITEMAQNKSGLEWTLNDTKSKLTVSEFEIAELQKQLETMRKQLRKSGTSTPFRLSNTSDWSEEDIVKLEQDMKKHMLQLQKSLHTGFDSGNCDTDSSVSDFESDYDSDEDYWQDNMKKKPNLYRPSLQFTDSNVNELTNEMQAELRRLQEQGNYPETTLEGQSSTEDLIEVNWDSESDERSKSKKSE